MINKLFNVGLSGFIPTLFAIAQGVDPTDPTQTASDKCGQNYTNSSQTDSIEEVDSKLRFSPEIFFGSLLFTVMISWSALALLQWLPVCKNESKKHCKQQEIRLKSIGEVNQQFLEIKEYWNNNNEEDKRFNVSQDSMNVEGYNLPVLEVIFTFFHRILIVKNNKLFEQLKSSDKSGLKASPLNLQTQL